MLRESFVEKEQAEKTLLVGKKQLPFGNILMEYGLPDSAIYNVSEQELDSLMQEAGVTNDDVEFYNKVWLLEPYNTPLTRKIRPEEILRKKTILEKLESVMVKKLIPRLTN